MRKQSTFLLAATFVSGLILMLTLSSHVINRATSKEVVNEIYLNDHPQKDWNSCVIKENSSWGGRCLSYGYSEDMYNVNLVNKCSEKVDLMCCVQRTNGQWRCFYRMDMSSSDTLSAYACKGTGKYLKWVRKAGEVEVKFPSQDQVNQQY